MGLDTGLRYRNNDRKDDFMTESDKLLSYIKLRDNVNEAVIRLNAETNRLSFGRLVSFAIGVIALTIGIVDSSAIAGIIGVLALVCFAVMVVISYKKNDILIEMRARLKVYDRYIARFSDDWKEFEDDGVDFLDASDSFVKEVAMDLDLLGEDSLYQYINVCGSSLGREKLYKYLTLAFSDRNDEAGSVDKLDRIFMASKIAIEERQDAVRELTSDEELSYTLETLIVKAVSRSKKPFLTKPEFEIAEADKEKKFTMITAILVFVLLCSSWVSLILAAFKVVSFVAPTALFVLMFIISQFMDGTFMGASSEAFSYVNYLASYEEFLSCIASHDYESDELKRIKSEISKDSEQAILGLKTISGAINLRANPLIYGILCTAVFYNALVYLRFASWKKKYISRVPKWIDAAGEMEAYLSLAVIGRVKSSASFAKIIDDNKPVVEFEGLYHPLIREDSVIDNPCHIRKGLLIITGSNMSGKTTYLRSLGINVVLAYSGAMVCADEASLSILKLFTSMRVMDDVGRGISSFYAEVLRIKAMSEYVRNKIPMLVLIDEIFKGTNSADRIIGAKGVIGTLNKPWVCGMITTHDFELCDLADEHEGILNYHFDEYFENDELKFEYKIKDGRCVTTNAIHILRMAGINIK